jgi:hypothetical protein
MTDISDHVTSPFAYLNDALPTRYSPPIVVAEELVDETSMRTYLLSNDVHISSDETGDVASDILSIFSGPEILFGDPSFIQTNHETWLEKIRLFTDAGRPIEFVTMAFAYKMSNQLKTNRLAPDAGEALMLRRFQLVLDAVERVYAPGARLTILEEGILGRCIGANPSRIAAYRAGIETIVRASGINRERISFHSLDDMVTEIPNFEARWIFEQERLRELFDSGDTATLEAHKQVTSGTRTSVPTEDFDPVVLAAAYDPSQSDPALRYVRDYVDKVAHRQFFAYRALLSLRDTTGYLARLRPNAIKLTVSPKPENLAVVPINTATGVLPYHGVPVLGADGGWTISYLSRLGEDYLGLTALRLAGDNDEAPIAYRETV